MLTVVSSSRGIGQRSSEETREGLRRLSEVNSKENCLNKRFSEVRSEKNCLNEIATTIG